MTLTPRRLRSAGAVVRYIWNHPANEGARCSAVARAVAFQARTHVARRTTVARLGLSSHIEIRPGYSAGESAVVYAPIYDFAEMTAWYRHLGPGDLFVDVGAFVGVYTLIAAEAGARAIAFEPGSEACRRLTRNVELNGADVEVRCAAVADRAGEAYQVASHRNVEELSATVTTLDDVLGDRRCAGVKIDVEGGERLVLEGARRALAARRIDLFQLEWNNRSEVLLGEDRAPVATVLRDAGYELCRPDRQGRLHPTDATGFGADVFARRRP